ncbi:hypothetical protein C8A05DRAFT_43221 [Staphylotrichum tortipilum]|uniref:Uncharacterized protein n=1 Tax=Staphylotrichum tortipilum TaxID=2831512 RepID=A0AAN6MMB3_9PEZI|nr:hypothetical protein C8A05DRAFT_43221 [Staphylotrichum longicolle]
MSATVLIGQAPTNLGPLTTTFTLPATCTVAVGEARGLLDGLIGGSVKDSAFLGQGCAAGKPIDATSCWPEISKGAEEKKAPFQGWGFYSPGLHCPVGYATACSATGGSGGGSGWPVQFKLRDGETAVGCCPSGYGCANINGQTCTSIATSTNVPTVTCDGNKIGPLGTQTVPDTKASITAFSLFAPMFQLNFQSTDLPSSTSTSSKSSSSRSTRITTNAPTTTSGTRTLDSDATTGLDTTLILDDTVHTAASTGGVPSVTPTLQENANNGTSTGSFSSAAKVAVGVGGAVAVLLAVVCGMFYVWRRRKARREEQELDRLYGIKDNSMSAGGDFASSGDIPGWYRGQRLNTPVHEPFSDVGRSAVGGVGGGGGLSEMAAVPAPPPSPYYRPYRP